MKYVEDRIFPSNNAFDIPTLREDMQPRTGLLLPFCGWGISRRIKQTVLTYHFYVDDYRFENLWLNPDIILKSSCREIVEPNFSVYDTTPIAFGLQQIYKKRWLSRYYQERGLRVYADLNVSSKFYEYNCLGIPEGELHSKGRWTMHGRNPLMWPWYMTNTRYIIVRMSRTGSSSLKTIANTASSG